MDFERKSVTTETGVTYFYPHKETGCYTSIVSQSNIEDLFAEAILDKKIKDGDTVSVKMEDNKIVLK